MVHKRVKDNQRERYLVMDNGEHKVVGLEEKWMGLEEERVSLEEE